MSGAFTADAREWRAERDRQERARAGPGLVVLDTPPPAGEDDYDGAQAPSAPFEESTHGERDEGAVIDVRAPYDNARLFQARLATPLRHHRGGFYEWNGSSWPEAGEDKLRAQLYAFLDGCQSKTKGRSCPVKPNASMVAGVLDALRAAAHLKSTIEPPAWVDGADGPPAHEVIACANGLLHLPTLRMQSHTCNFFNLNALDYAYDRNSPPPRLWLAFLDQVWPDDPESIATLQQVFGYLLTADTSQQKSFLIVGPKRSGKGTIGRVLAETRRTT